MDTAGKRATTPRDGRESVHSKAMPTSHTIGQQRYQFADLRTLLAKASPLRSGDQLAGVAAQDARERIAAIARANGLKPLPSAANFVAIDCGRDGAFARRVLSELITRDVFVRMPGVSPLDRCIRVSAGLPSDLDVFEEVLPQALRAAAE